MEGQWFEDVSVPRLMLDARGAYREAASRALAEAACDDIPRGGGLVLAGLDQSSPEPSFTTQADAVAFLRLSKQRSSQLIDTLVLRGYLERRSDPDDARSRRIALTERGAAIVPVIREAVAELERDWAGRLGAERFAQLRTLLVDLNELI